MREPTNEFGKEIRKLRNEGTFQYSQEHLAKLVGIKASYISQIETGKRVPKIRIIRRLASHLGVTTNYLLGKIGMVEMDMVRALADNHERVKEQIPKLPEEQVTELANYLTYLDFKAHVLK